LFAAKIEISIMSQFLTAYFYFSSMNIQNESRNKKLKTL